MFNTHYDVHMRTTLTLDDDVADALRERALLHNLPFKQVVNDTLRRGLGPNDRDDKQPAFRVAPNLSALAAGIDPMKLNQLNDQLQADDFTGRIPD